MRRKRFEQPACFSPTAAAEFRHQSRLPNMPGDFQSVLLQQPFIRACEAILWQKRDCFE